MPSSLEKTPDHVAALRLWLALLVSLALHALGLSLAGARPEWGRTTFLLTGRLVVSLRSLPPPPATVPLPAAAIEAPALSESPPLSESYPLSTNEVPSAEAPQIERPLIQPPGVLEDIEPLLNRPPPDEPPINIGTLAARLHIDAEGKVTEVVLPPVRFTDAERVELIARFMRMRFKPAVLNDNPIASELAIEITVSPLDNSLTAE